jgi:hypothetical protein
MKTQLDQMKVRLVKLLDRIFDFTKRKDFAIDSVYSVFEKGGDMSIPAGLLLFLKSFVLKKKCFYR